jgi:hypothetical protein
LTGVETFAFSTGERSVHQVHDFRGTHELAHVFATQFPAPDDAFTDGFVGRGAGDGADGARERRPAARLVRDVWQVRASAGALGPARHVPRGCGVRGPSLPRRGLVRALPDRALRDRARPSNDWLREEFGSRACGPS